MTVGRYKNLMEDPEFMAELESDRIEEERALARQDELAAGYADDVRKLYRTWQAQTGASPISGQILRTINDKAGSIDLIELCTLDSVNLEAAMRLIEICAVPSLISDSGLTCDAAGNQLLSAADVESLSADSATKFEP